MRNKRDGILVIIALGLLLVFSVTAFAQRSRTEEKPVMNIRAQEVTNKNGESCEMMKGSQNMMGMMEMCNKMMSNMEKGSSTCCMNRNDENKQQELKDQERKENKPDIRKDKRMQQNK